MPSANAAPASTHDTVHDVANRWNAAAATWNPDALAALYAPEAVFFGGRPGHAVGYQAILGYFVSYAETLRSAHMKLVDPCVIELGPDTLLMQGHADFRFVLADGSATSSTLRATWILARRQGAWQILQHHVSPTPEAPPIR